MLEWLARLKRTTDDDDPLSGIIATVQEEVLTRFATSKMIAAHNGRAVGQRDMYGPHIDIRGVAAQEKVQMCPLVYAAAAADPAMCHDFARCGGNYESVLDDYLIPMMQKKV